MTGAGAPDMAALEAKVAGSSFYTAMKLMPKAERAGMFAIYAFCRAVDDIADDGDAPRPERAAELDAWRAAIEAIYSGGDPDRAAFLVEPVWAFGLTKPDFLAVIDGMQMDVDDDIVAPDLNTLDLYCDRVASAVGRLSVKVFGMQERPGIALAHHLGRALQLTNILRDLDEDAGIGRLYLPREALDGAGIKGDTPAEVLADPRLDAACRTVAATARRHYRDAGLTLSTRPQGRLMAPRLMGAVYGGILDRMEQVGWAPPRDRVKLPKSRLVWLALRSAMR